MVDGIVFVLAVNRSELAHSIRAVYGGKFDALGYLRRFFDIDFLLPDSERLPFVEACLEKTGIANYFRSKDASLPQDDGYHTITAWLRLFLDTPGFSLRRISQTIHRLGLVFASLPDDGPSLAAAAAAAVVMRTLDPDLYSRFKRSEVTDQEAIESLLPHVRRSTASHERCYLEAIIIVAAMEIRGPDRPLQAVENSPLLKSYREQLETAQQDGKPGDASHDRARGIVSIVDQILQNELFGRGRLGFVEAVNRIELLSPSLIGNDEQRSDGGRGN